MKFIRTWTSAVIFFGLSVAVADINSAQLKKSEKEAVIKMYDGFLKELIRLDGVGFLPRNNRKISWDNLTKKLKQEIKSANTKMEIGRIFARTDGAYTNLHAHIVLASEYDFNTEGRLNIAAAFQPEEVDADGITKKYLLSSVKKELFVHLEENDRPIAGDQLLAINHRSMREWSDENFEFCKFPYKSQCEANFYDNFRREILSWYRRKPLIYTLLRGGRTWDVLIPISARVDNKNESSSSNVIEKPLPCDLNKERYPEFKMVYQGFHACVFENSKFPNMAILRIRSFNYSKLEGKTELDHIRKEVNKFASDYWKKRASSIQTLILDVVENYGGDSVTVWDAQLLDQPFQDQWVQFKNVLEMDGQDWRKEIFYHDAGKEKIYEQIKGSLKWKDISIGSYLPPMPQFCATEDANCLTEKWQPRPNEFKGNIVVLTDSWCISSCVGFVWTLKNYLKERVSFVGIPDSGDSTYARAYIEGSIKTDNNNSYSIAVMPRPGGAKTEVGRGAIFRQVVSVSRSTDENGNIVSGRPMSMNKFIGPRWNEAPDDWVGRIIKSLMLSEGHIK